MKVLKSLKTKTFSSSTLIVAVAVFVALAGNVAFFSSAYDIFGNSGQGKLFVASLFLFVLAIFILVLSALCHRATVKPVLILFLLLSSVITYFTTKYGTIFDQHMIANVMQTDAGEAGDLFNYQMVFYVGVLGLLPSLLIYRARTERTHWKTETVVRLKLAGGAAACLVLLYGTLGAHYVSMFRENRALLGLINPGYALFSSVKVASLAMRSTGRSHVIVGADAQLPRVDNHRELVIMVVGETVRADHWGLNGYAKDTTPRLKAEGVINFPDVWSCGTSTAESVPCMFSNLGRAKFSAAGAKSADNALDILNRAGVSILWRDNNSSSKGVADRVAYQDFSTPQTNPVCDIECRDEGMLAGLQDYIDQHSGDILIVLHQMGNHGPAYYKRYPAAFEKFKPVCQTNDLGSCTAQEINNAYDNAILYADDFLAKVIALLKKNDGRSETAMLYVSDHGESLGEMGLYLHGMPYAFAPDSQKHVPLVLWTGEAIEHDLRLAAMEQRRQRTWSHDNIFSTLLGLFEINSTAYDPHMDLLEHSDIEQAAAQ